MDINQKVALKIKELREARNISQASIAENLGISPSAFSRLENGEVQINLLTMEKIAENLEVTFLELLECKSMNVNNYMNNQFCPIQYGTLNISVPLEDLKKLIGEVLDKK